MTNRWLGRIEGFEDEIPTLLLLVVCYLAIGTITINADLTGQTIAVLILVPFLVLHSSLQHEVIHGHPTSFPSFNDTLVFPAVGLFIPYLRFKEQHLAHHHDPRLTDPHDDPESNYLDPITWNELPKWRRLLEQINNTLLGRMFVGPALGLCRLYKEDVQKIVEGHPGVLRAYVHHLFGSGLVVTWLYLFGKMSFEAYILAAYSALSILKIRTFLEHQAHERASCRSVIIEDRGILSLLFLNNNYHALHHASPKLVWHKLPTMFEERREQLLRRNGGYRYCSYWQIFSLYFLRPKDPVAHPLMSSGNEPNEGNPEPQCVE